jgi:uncharacterized protein
MSDQTAGDQRNNQTPSHRACAVREDIAYVLPMFVFLGFVWLGSNWSKDHPWTYVAAYVARAIIVAGLLVWLWPCYTKVRWNHWWLGVIVGVIGIFQWVGMQLFLQQQHEHFRPGPDFFNPEKFFQTPAGFWSFVVVRIVGAVLVVPVMEELFWRDYLWRQVLAPNDFKLAAVGEWSWTPFLIVAGAFAFVHGNWWLTSIVWALMVGALLVYTKSLGACIIAHSVTNLLLALYVLWKKDWAFW